MKDTRNLLSFAAALTTMLTSAPALACMADGPEGYVSGLIWENRHAVVPDDATILKVEALRPHPELFMGIVAKVIEGPVDMVGSTITIVPANRNSCVGMGRLTGFVVVREQPEGLGEGSENPVYVAIDYLPDARDRSRGMKRENNWFYPGDPAPEEERPLEVEASE